MLNIDKRRSTAALLSLVSIGMMILIVAVLLVKVLPIFNQVFEQMGQQMTGVSRVLLNLGNAIGNYVYVFIGIFVICVLGFFYFTKSSKGREQIYQMACRVPFTSNICEQLALSRFTQALSLTLKSGLMMEESIQTSAELVNHMEIRKKTDRCLELMNQGEDLSSCLTKSQLFHGV